MESRQNHEDYYQACKTIFEQSDPSLENFNDYRACKEYFDFKPKMVHHIHIDDQK